MSKNSASVTPLDSVEENKAEETNADVKVDVKPSPSNDDPLKITDDKTDDNNNNNNNKLASKKDENSNLDAVDTSHTKIRSQCANKMLEKTWFVTITTVLTLYALFGDDVRLATTEKPIDMLFYVLSFLALLVFIIELIITGLGQAYYFEFWFDEDGLRLPSFYFWLDVAATVSLYPDVVPLFVPEDPYAVPPSADAVKAGRASRAGTRAGRIIRLVRIVRMVKLVKAVRGKDVDKKVSESKDEPSAVGSKLSEVTIRKVIMIVLLSIIVLPILDGSLDGAENLQHVFGLQELHRVPMDRNASGDIPGNVFAERVRQYGRDVGKVVHVKLSPNCPSTTCNTAWSATEINSWLSATQFQPSSDPFSPYDLEASDVLPTLWKPMSDVIIDEKSIYTQYRIAEISRVSILGCYDADGKLTDKADTDAGISDCTSTCYLNIKAESQAGARLSMAKTVFMMFVLVGFSMLLNNDTNALVVGPLERMMSMVKKLAKNPLGALTDDDDAPNYDDNEDPENQYETVMLERSLMKIGGLLQVGFGAAGADIIARNMGRGDMRLMEPGRKITSIFGFGIIEEFTDTVSCLEQEITQYINSIASIVHTGCSSYFGAPNKNIGSAFLLAWKICDGSLPGLVDPRDPPDDAEGIKAAERAKLRASREQMEDSWPHLAGDGKFSRMVKPQELVDSALAAVVRIRMGVEKANNDGTFATFVAHPKMIKRFGHFKVKMGFGLHLGWAIEGAIGSKFKIDASYLSPNVNLSARLEAATHQFHTPMLMSHWLVEEMSEKARKMCRLIDRVTVKGSEIPMGLYTFDIVQFPRDVDSYGPRFDSMGVQESVDFSEHKWMALRAGVPNSFYAKFENAVNSYTAGDWPSAKKLLEESLTEKKDDGPAVSLMAVMARSNFVAPDGWKGYRALTSK